MAAHRLGVLKAYLVHIDEELARLRVGLAHRINLAAAENDKLDRAEFDAIRDDFDAKAASIQTAARAALVEKGGR